MTGEMPYRDVNLARVRRFRTRGNAPTSAGGLCRSVRPPIAFSIWFVMFHVFRNFVLVLLLGYALILF